MENQTIVKTEQEGDMKVLTHSIIEWRRLKEKCDEVKAQLRDDAKSMKILEDIILRIMKNYNIGALDLKNSGGRVLYKKQKRQGGLGQKNMAKLMAAHLQSEEKATELMKYIQDNRPVITTEKIAYEKPED